MPLQFPLRRAFIAFGKAVLRCSNDNRPDTLTLGTPQVSFGVAQISFGPDAQTFPPFESKLEKTVSSGNKLIKEEGVYR